MRQSREIVSQFYADFDSGDIDTMVESFSDALETTDPGMGTVHGLAPFRGRFVGTFTGPLSSPDGDAEPTGASVDLRFADVSRVSAGKIVSYHTYYDQLGLLTQLGLME